MWSFPSVVYESFSLQISQLPSKILDLGIELDEVQLVGHLWLDGFLHSFLKNILVSSHLAQLLNHVSVVILLVLFLRSQLRADALSLFDLLLSLLDEIAELGRAKFEPLSFLNLLHEARVLLILQIGWVVLVRRQTRSCFLSGHWQATLRLMFFLITARSLDRVKLLQVVGGQHLVHCHFRCYSSLHLICCKWTRDPISTLRRLNQGVIVILRTNAAHFSKCKFNNYFNIKCILTIFRSSQ